MSRLSKVVRGYGFRMWQFVLVAAAFLVLVAYSGGTSNSGWIFKQFNNISELSIGIIALYYGGRCMLKKRTHELDADDGRDRENTILISLAIVIGCSLI